MKNKQIEKMNELLANLNVIYKKIQNFHWNMVGKVFFTLHPKYDELYEDIEKQIDTVAERILAIGGKPYSTLKKYLEISTIKEIEVVDIQAIETLQYLKDDYILLKNMVIEIKKLTDEVNDYGSSAIMDEYILYYDKLLWMINAYLK